MVTLEIPEEVPAVTIEGATAITSTIPTTSGTTTITGTEARRPRIFLPNGSPSRPNATATCRPQTVGTVCFGGSVQIVLLQMALDLKKVAYQDLPCWKKRFQRI